VFVDDGVDAERVGQTVVAAADKVAAGLR
jgi:hypothetical protein